MRENEQSSLLSQSSGITAGGHSAADNTPSNQNTMPDSPQDDGMGPPDGLGGSAPKRRRVTRACDECRRKKIKCDGKQVYFSLFYDSHVAVYPLRCVFIQYIFARKLTLIYSMFI